jgi:hypothetical protein
MGPSVSVTLDKERYLRFGFRNSRLAVSALQNAMPARAEKLNISDVGMLVLRQDQDAILVCLYRGLNHEDRETVKLDAKGGLAHMRCRPRMSEFSCRSPAWRVSIIAKSRTRRQRQGEVWARSSIHWPRALWPDCQRRHRGNSLRDRSRRLGAGHGTCRV